MTNHIQRGAAAMQAKNPPEALEWFQQAVTANPKDAQAHACLGQTLCWLGRRSEGLTHLRQSGALLAKKARKTRDIKLLLGLTEQLQHWNDYQGALDLGRQAVQINGNEVRGFQLLALTYSRMNQKKAALTAGRQAARMAPHSAMLQILLGTLEAAEGLNEDAKSRFTKALTLPLTTEEAFRTHKELARLLDKMGEFTEVFGHLHAAGRLSSALPEVQKQDAALVPGMIVTNTAEFDRDLLGRWAAAEFQDTPQAPIFLVGFMRSGTTLTQEVIGAHPDVFVADESDLVYRVVEELERMVPGASTIPARLRQLDWAGVLHLRNFYWQRAQMLYGDELGQRRLLDKTTMNTIDLGLINVLFPDAKVVFVMRDPRDVCLSCFMQTMIPTPSTVHLLTWRGTAEFYAQIMNWWMAVKPRLSLDVIEFRYEDAVANFEGTFRKVFDFVDLSWDPKVAEFHKNAIGKYIGSPSHAQVAQPLYASSVARWRHYAAEFEPISGLLQPFLDAFEYKS
jgi:Tfp pilus assembly protein PilF